VRVPAEEIDAELERIRERHETLVEEPEGTAAADGHVVTADFEGRVDGEPFRGGSAKGVDIRLGSGTMIPGFEEQLVGARAGEDRQVEVTFPDDYGVPELDGKEAVFDCHVVAVRRRELPALDDELAKDVGDFETLDALREKIESDKRAQQESAAERALHQSLLDALIEATDFEVPPGVIERQLQSQLRSMHDQFHGRVPEDVLHQQLRRMQEDGRPMAERRVRESFLLEAIATEQEIEATPADVDARLQEMAGDQGMELEQLRSIAERQGWLHAIEHELVEQKAYAWLAERANVEEFDPASESEADAPPDVAAEAEGDSSS
jgi:trigger factor